MGIYSYEEAFGCADKTSQPMRQAIAEWFAAYYGREADAGDDPCQRVAYAVVSKLVRTVFGEYRSASEDAFCRKVLKRLDQKARQAMEMSLVGGECYIKPCPGDGEFQFHLIPRNHVLIFGRAADGELTDVGTAERSVHGRCYYTLLERRTVDENGYLTIQNRLFRSYNPQSLGAEVPLNSCPDYAGFAPEYRYETPVGSVGLVQLRTPMLNCVDGSADGVSVFAPAMGLIRAIDENEGQLRGEFTRGQSRIIASRDLLREDENGAKSLADHLFVGLDDDPEQVGITIFSPELRHEAYLERKQEYLRNVESVIGLKRGMLSDANVEDRTATEIASSAGDYNLTVMDFQRVWGLAVEKTLWLCLCLGRLYGLAGVPENSDVAIDWGNGILYDEDKTWQDYQGMVASGLLKPEIALGWRFNMPADTEEDRTAIRQRLMP